MIVGAISFLFKKSQLRVRQTTILKVEVLVAKINMKVSGLMLCQSHGPWTLYLTQCLCLALIGYGYTHGVRSCVRCCGAPISSISQAHGRSRSSFFPCVSACARAGGEGGDLVFVASCFFLLLYFFPACLVKI